MLRIDQSRIEADDAALLDVEASFLQQWTLTACRLGSRFDVALDIAFETMQLCGKLLVLFLQSWHLFRFLAMFLDSLDITLSLAQLVSILIMQSPFLT